MRSDFRSAERSYGVLCKLYMSDETKINKSPVAIFHFELLSYFLINRVLNPNSPVVPHCSFQ